MVGDIMKNPLYRRLPRELKQDLGKYFVIFAFLVLLIGAVSGFLIATDSMAEAYDNGLEEYKTENGHVAFNMKPEASVLEAVEKEADLKFFDLSYIELTDQNDKHVRVYKNRTDVNLPCILWGRLPENSDEIAIDRLFAEKNNISEGSVLELEGRRFTVCGAAALPDYSCLYEKNTDMMFNASNFTFALVTEEGFDSVAGTHTVFNYAWRFNESRDSNTDKQNSEDEKLVLEALEKAVRAYDEKLVEDEIKKQLSDAAALMQAAGLSEAAGLMDGADFSDAAALMDGADFSDAAALMEAAGLSEAAITDEVIKSLEDEMLSVEDFIARYRNQAITFSREDMGKDSATMMVFCYILIAVISFVFAVTISNTIISEAGVIGTLRALGYSRGELLRHYMVLPTAVTLLGAIVGNIVGYTVLKDVMADVYLNSYSLAAYKTLWNANAFIQTTIVPVVITILINLFVVAKKLRLSPIRFLRRDLSSKGRKKVPHLNEKIPFMHRFRLRVIIQNIPNYLTLFLGIFLGGTLIIFGLMFSPMLNSLKDTVLEQRLCDYQYIVMNTDAVTSDSEAEKYSLASLKTTIEGYVEDEVSVYGIEENSRYFNGVLPKNSDVLVSSSLAEKYGLKSGDTVKLANTYTGDSYEFTVGGTYDYDASIAVFMSRPAFAKAFSKSSDYFSGYFSNRELTDIDEKYVAKLITARDLTVLSDQLADSIGGFTDYIAAFGVVIFMLLMYLLSRQVIEKNSVSISMSKILGFRNGEIGKIYILSTSFVVIASLLITCPIIDVALRLIFEKYLYTLIPGYIPYMSSGMSYVEMVGLGIICYAIIAALQLRKISRIPKTDALKTVE